MVKSLEDKVKIKWWEYFPVIGFVSYNARNDLNNGEAYSNSIKLFGIASGLYYLCNYLTNR